MLDSKSFVAALSVILVSELGDKTFFIAAIMAMTHSRVTVYLAAMSALITMTVMSVGLGMTTAIIPTSVTYYASIVLFFVFGFKMLWDAKSMSGGEAQEEFKEVEKTIEPKKNEELNGSPKAINGSLTSVNGSISEVNGSLSEVDGTQQSRTVRYVSNGLKDNGEDVPSEVTIDGVSKESETSPRSQEITASNSGPRRRRTGPVTDGTNGPVIGSPSFGTRFRENLVTFASLVFVKTFTMTFVAEWGDRSQITTVILAAKEDPLSVSTGALVGHGICSLIAVVAGRLVAFCISARTVTIVGGILFIGFAIFALVMGE